MKSSIYCYNFDYIKKPTDKRQKSFEYFFQQNETRNY